MEFTEYDAVDEDREALMRHGCDLSRCTAPPAHSRAFLHILFRGCAVSFSSQYHSLRFNVQGFYATMSFQLSNTFN